MSFLLDTNVLSEVTKQRPNPNVLAWLAYWRPDELFVSAITAAEVRYAIDAAPKGAKHEALERWYSSSINGRAAQLLPINLAVAEAWGWLRRRAELAKRTMPVLDGFIAATAEVRGLTLVTRNARDFKALGGPILDPWTEDPPA